jgi:hypothetical protein
MNITTPITANFVYAGTADTPAMVPSEVNGKICLVQAGGLTGVYSVQANSCKAQGAIAVLIFNTATGAINSPSPIPVFAMANADGVFLRDTVGSDATTKLSRFQIRINVAPPAANPTAQHNCPSSQAVAAYVGPGTANFTPNESLCLPAGVGQAVEPSMTVDSQGTIYVESIRGVPGGLDLWRWYQTADGGPNHDGTLPFKYEGQPDGCGIFPANTICTTAGVAPGGGDGDVAVNAPDPANMRTPNLAVVSLSAAEVTGSHSTDRADSFVVPPNPATAHIPFDDRMWIDGLDDAKHVYMEYHDFGTTSQIFVQRSNDGGETYNDTLPSTVVSPALQPAVGPPTGNIAGQIKVDQSSCPSHGNLYQIFVGPDNAIDNANNDPHFINAAYVGVASNVSLTSSSTIPFTDYRIFSCGAGSKCPTGLGLGNLFPALAVDNFGYVYAVWSDNSNIYYSFSQHQGKSWSPAIKLTQNTPQAGKSNVFPWVAADANGHVAVAWYGADQAGDSNMVSKIDTHWNVYVAETVKGHAAAPAFTQGLATDHSNHTGQISTGGLLGSSDRSLADFFQIAIDPTSHLVNAAYADNHAGTSVTYFTRQKKAAPGIVVTGACAGSCHQADGEGDEPGKNGGSAHFRIHEDDCNPQKDSEDFSDPGSGTDFHSTQVNSVAYDDVAHTVTIAGLGTNNGSPVAFTIVAADSSLVPPGLFSITLSNGYSNSGRLLGGSIRLY